MIKILLPNDPLVRLPISFALTSDRSTPSSAHPPETILSSCESKFFTSINFHILDHVDVLNQILIERQKFFLFFEWVFNTKSTMDRRLRLIILFIVAWLCLLPSSSSNREVKPKGSSSLRGLLYKSLSSARSFGRKTEAESRQGLAMTMLAGK